MYLFSNIMAHFDEHELLSDRQHAFRKWHRCETHLTTVINDWTKILGKKGQVDTFILDFEKAFDTPPHELLKSKLLARLHEVHRAIVVTSVVPVYVYVYVRVRVTLSVKVFKIVIS